MKVAAKLSIGFLLVVLLIWVTVFFAQNTYTRIQVEFEALEKDVVPEVVAVSQLEILANQIAYETIAYINTGREEDKQAVVLAAEQLEAAGQEYLAYETSGGPGEQERAEILVAGTDAFASSVVKLVRLKGLELVSNEVLLETAVYPLFPPMLQLFEDNKAFTMEKLAVAEADAHRAYTSGVYILLLAAGLVTVLAAAMALFISRSITRPLHALHRGTEVIGQGDLSYRVGTGAKDEIGQLSRAFDRMTGNLKNSTASIEDLNKEIADRERAEEQVRRQNEFLNTVLDSLSYPFYVLDVNDYTVKMSNQAAKAEGLPDAATCYSLIYKTDKPCGGKDQICPLEEVKKTKKAVVVEHTRYDGNGSARNIEVHGYPIFDAEGNVVQMIEYSLDITDRKKIEEELQESQRFSSSLLQNSPNPVVVIDPDTSVRYVNPAFEKLTGFTLSETLGVKAPHPWWPEENMEEIDAAFKKAMTSGGKRGERVFQKKNGERFWVAINSTGVKHGGRQDYFLMNWLDITEAKRMEEQLRESEGRYRNLFEGTHDMIQSVDPDGHFLFANKAWLETMGYTEAELPGLNLFQIISPESLPHCQEMFARVMEGESVNDTQATFVAKDGRLVLVEGNATGRYVDGKLMATQGIFRDITERKKREQLQLGENYVLTLLGQGANLSELLDAIVHLGEQDDPSIKGSVLLFDPTKGLLFQASAPSLPDDYQELFKNGIPVGPESGSCGTAAYRKERVSVPDIANSPLFKPAEEVIKRAVNNSLLAVWSQPIIASNGDLLGTIANYSNKVGEPSAENLWVLEWSASIAAIAIERKKAEEERRQRMEELRIAYQKLKELDRMKDSFLSTVSHELRTPLTSIKSFSEILLTYDEDRETQKEFLNIIKEESDRLTRLINDFLDLAKIESGRMQWETVELSVAEVIKTAINATQALAAKTSLKVKVTVSPNLPAVTSDKDRLVQVVTNLLSNAIKFTPDGGNIEVKAQTLEGDKSRKKADMVMVSVTDSGIGIDPKDHKSIFEKFKQVGDTLTDKPKGTGLGLPICKEIIEHFGGRLWVESELGKGSTFFFTLPLAQTAEAEAPEAPETGEMEEPAGAADTGDKTILVVDDEANIRRFLSHELKKRGYRVIQAAGGNRAIELARKHHPDLITLDVLMNGMSGFDATAVLKNDPETGDIPILIISVVEDRKRAYQLGVNDYLTKPFKIEALVGKVNQLLRDAQKKILVVDDDKNLVRSLKYQLGKRGYSASAAYSGKLALKKVGSQPPDLILLDIIMPEMDGYEVMKALKHKPETARIPILVMTGVEIDGSRVKALSVGAADYFTKSGGFGKMFQTIDSILGGKPEA
jgi:PAS domain S-box-containing protein